jgi:hypothetical protein
MAYADRFTADAIIEPVGYRQLTSLSSAKGVQIGEGRVALIQAVTQNVRYRDDGTDPTASVGMVIFAGQSVWYTGNLRKIRFIEEAVGAEINILAYK